MRSNRVRKPAGGCRCMQNAMCRIEGLEETLRDLMDATEGVLDFSGAPLIKNAKQFGIYADKALAAIHRATDLLTSPIREAGGEVEG